MTTGHLADDPHIPDGFAISGHRRAMNLRQGLARSLWDLSRFEDAATSGRSFPAKAFRQAIWALDSVSPDLDEDIRTLLAVPGIGPVTAGLIEEFRESGTLARLESLRQALPGEASAMARLPRMTPTRLRWLKAELGVDSLSDLATAIDTEALSELRGVGPGTLQLWRQRLGSIGRPGMPIYRAASYAARLGEHLESHLPGIAVTVAGSVRRLEEWVEVIELAVVGDGELGSFLRRSSLTLEVRSRQPDRLELLSLGGAVVVHHGQRAKAGLVLLRATGPAEHVLAVERAAASSAGGLTSEEDLYHRAGSGVIPPPARGGDFPLGVNVIRADDLRGDLHLHTTSSPDGRQSLETVVGRAALLGYRYLAVTDHGSGLHFGGLSPTDIVAQREAIDGMRDRFPDVSIFQGAELNIDKEGGVEYDESVLETLDFRLAGVHSHFGLDPVEQTRRLIRAVSDPMIHAISHLTGRRIGSRPPMEFDFPAVLEAAVDSGTALEVNGHLDRLDLSASHSVIAAAAGARFLANSDAHRPGEMGNVGNAVAVLQKARVTAAPVINTWDAGRVALWLKDKSEAASGPLVIGGQPRAVPAP